MAYVRRDAGIVHQLRSKLILATALLCALFFIGYGTIDSCSDWQGRYKRFIYAEMLKIGPVIQNPGEDAIGHRPLGCPRPGRTLTPEEYERYRREGIGPNEFAP